MIPRFAETFTRALLLVLGPLLEIAVAEDLQVHQPQANDGKPKQEQSAQKIESMIGGAELVRWQSDASELRKSKHLAFGNSHLACNPATQPCFG